MIILVLFGFGLLVASELPSLIKKQYWRELVVFSLFILGALIFSVLQVLGVELPYIDAVLLETFTKLGLYIK